MKIAHINIAALAKKLIELERCGLYEEGLTELSQFWAGFGTLPNVSEMDDFSAAEIFLRCGSLIGFLGHNKQIKDSQTESKNLLTEAHRRFLDIGDQEKIAECENYLALAYWRGGELREAESFIEEALSHDLPNSSDAKIYAHLIKSLIYLSGGRHDEIIENLEEVESDFRKYGDAFLNGSFRTNYALALKNLDRLDDALQNLKMARFYHCKSRHKIYLATVENNLAQLYRTKNQFVEAHQSVDSGIKIFRQIKDRTREGVTIDTKALIYFFEGKYQKALETAEKAVKVLEKCENLVYKTEAHLTKAKILVYLDDFSAAVMALFEAVQIARVGISEEAAKNLIKQFETALVERNKFVAEKEAKAARFELVLPSWMSHYSDIQGVKINNSHLENVGLRPDSLAIVAKDEIKRGDLVAVLEKATDTVICGFYDHYCGIVCLEIAEGNPHLFDEMKIEIYGKIIGVCIADAKENGKMIVEPVITQR